MARMISPQIPAIFQERSLPTYLLDSDSDIRGELAIVLVRIGIFWKPLSQC